MSATQLTLTVDVVIDDYLRVLVRTSPWLKQRDEELLMPFAEWLYEQPDLSFELVDITPATSRSYANANQLDDADRVDLDAALHRLMLWSQENGYVQTNPFPAAPAT